MRDMLLVFLMLWTQTVGEGAASPAPAGKIWVRGDFPEPVSSGKKTGTGAARSGQNKSDYYPVEAIRRREQGRVLAGVTVGIDGKATRCWISQSSGSSALDEYTCRIALTRVRWTPAKDDAGSPKESEATLPINWRLPK